jgi:SAM-dependent methyltransferase
VSSNRPGAILEQVRSEQKDLESHQKVWDEAGRDDPLWSVLSVPGKQGRWNVEEFFQTGVDEIAEVMRYLERQGIAVQRGRALDFGCGVGRLSQALAAHFGQVDGVDISPSMVDNARRFNRHPDRCRYHVNLARDLSLFKDASFDFIYSNIVLQHMDPEWARGYIAEFIRCLEPDGVLLFQLPSRQRLRGRIKRLLPAPLLRAYRQARHHGHPAAVVHGIARDEVVSFCQAHGAVVLDVQPSDVVGYGWESFRYCCRRVRA